MRKNSSKFEKPVKRLVKDNVEYVCSYLQSYTICAIEDFDCIVNGAVVRSVKRGELGGKIFTMFNDVLDFPIDDGSWIESGSSIVGDGSVVRNSYIGFDTTISCEVVLRDSSIEFTDIKVKDGYCDLRGNRTWFGKLIVRESNVSNSTIHIENDQKSVIKRSDIFGCTLHLNDNSRIFKSNLISSTIKTASVFVSKSHIKTADINMGKDLFLESIGGVSKIKISDDLPAYIVDSYYGISGDIGLFEYVYKRYLRFYNIQTRKYNLQHIGWRKEKEYIGEVVLTSVPRLVQKPEHGHAMTKFLDDITELARKS